MFVQYHIQSGQKIGKKGRGQIIWYKTGAKGYVRAFKSQIQ